MNRIYFRKEVEKRVIVILREIFRLDDDFTYADNDTETAILVTPLYPRPDTDNLLPHIVLTNIGYQFPVTTLFNNLEGEVRDPITRKVIGYRYATLAPVQVQLVCLSTVAGEAELLSDKLTDYLAMTAKTLFREQGFQVGAVAAGNAEMRSPYPQFEYASGVSLSAELYYTWTETEVPGKDVLMTKIRTAIATYSG